MSEITEKDREEARQRLKILKPDTLTEATKLIVVELMAVFKAEGRKEGREEERQKMEASPSASLEDRARDLMNFLVEYLGLPAYNQVAAHDKTVQVMTTLEAEVREECARIAENHRKKQLMGEDSGSAKFRHGLSIAKAIRERKEQ